MTGPLRLSLCYNIYLVAARITARTYILYVLEYNSHAIYARNKNARVCVCAGLQKHSTRVLCAREGDVVAVIVTRPHARQQPRARELQPSLAMLVVAVPVHRRLVKSAHIERARDAAAICSSRLKILTYTLLIYVYILSTQCRAVKPQ